MGPSYQYKAKMLRVIDGDTYEVQVDLGFRIFHTIHVRLHNFNTAELRSSNKAEVLHAQQARDFVAGLIPVDSEVILLTVKAAVYNRWEAQVLFENGKVNLATVLAANSFARRPTY